MKRIAALLTAVLLLLTSMLSVSAASYDARGTMDARAGVYDSFPPKALIDFRLDLDDHLTVFSYRLIGDDYAYACVINNDRMGKYLYTYSPESTLYLFDGETITELVDAYRQGRITDDQLDMIAAALPSKAYDIYEFTGGFSVAFKYEDQYKEPLTDEERQNVEYREIQHHQSTNQETDWVLACDLYRFRGTENDNAMVIDDSIVTFCDGSSVYPSAYAVYDVLQGRFFDLYDIKDYIDAYDGLSGALSDLNISRAIGDADDDYRLTIIDATVIQRYLASIRALSEDVDIYHMDGRERRYSDFDLDGEVTIIDATKIQRTLASIK